MSVLLFSKQEVNTMIQEIATNETEERAIWYGYIANVTAFNTQYQENELVDYKNEEVLPTYENRENFLEGSISSLLYNVYTNAGTCFLQDKWVKELELLKVKEATKNEIKELI